MAQIATTTGAAARKTNASLVVLLAFAGFVGLGIQSSLLNVAWESMRTTFELPLEAVGTLLFIQTSGYIVSSFVSGKTAAAFGNGRSVLSGALVMVAGFALMVVAPSWELVILAGALLGYGGGTLDAGMNTYVATYHSAREMNWLHASFGAGATLGPLIVTWTLTQALSWRVSYAIVGALMLAVALAYLATLRLWRDDRTGTVESADGSVEHGLPVRQTLMLPAMWLSLALFIVYAGVEIGVGQWAFSLLTEARGVTEAAAGTWVALYWGSFTVGRIFFGAIGDRIARPVILRGCMIWSIIGAALLLVQAAPMVSLAGLVLLGFAQAPLFPLLVLDTPERVGRRHAQNAIGFQVSAAGVGVATMPGIAGVLAARFGFETLAAFFVVLAVGVLVLYEISRRARPAD